MSLKNIVVGLVVKFFCAGALLTQAQAETNPQFYAVQASAQVQSSPPKITLKWSADPNATGYTISRKNSAVAPWSTVGTAGGAATSFTDANVLVGNTYEYQIIKTTTLGYKGSGYLAAGIQAPLVDSRGKVVLVVDKTYAAQLAFELARLEEDLAGDGWIVVRRDVNRTDSVVTVKNLIKTEYNADPSKVKAVFLFGHVPVPYSGNFNPDGHPDHQGAWPADAYYADMDGFWTDTIVNNSSAQRVANRNVPGDGKFDQSEIPSDLELAVGRVDLSNMTCFSNKTPSRSELDLLRQYLNKDHNFRHGLLPLPRRGLVCDNFGERSGEAFAASGWRNFAPMFGAENTTAVGAWNYFPTLKSNGYLWSYGTGGGSYYTCNGVGGSDDFALNDIKTVFTMYLGSYFGDWDNESNFLRAPLGSSTYTLTTSWAGRPHWFYHHMALGETIGHSTRLSQNNRGGGTYFNMQNYAARMVHAALLGDPTLRMHPVLPPFNVTASAGSSGVSIAWATSSDTAIVGYHVYRGASVKGPFTRLTSAPVNATSYLDGTGTGSHVYMVRAVKLEQSASGSYYNASQGAFSGAEGSPSPSPSETVPNAPATLAARAVSASRVDLTWSDRSAVESGFRVYRRQGTGTWELIASPAANIQSYSDAAAPSGSSLAYMVYAYNSYGNSGPSETVSVTTPAAPSSGAATFISRDLTTSGSWKTAYGSEGYQLAADGVQNPSYATVGISAASQWTWAPSTSLSAALQKASGADRIAACWYSGASFDVALNFSDSNFHRVSFYMLDYENAGRQQTVEIIDGGNGALLSSQSVSSFNPGAYLSWDLKGKVIVRFKRTGGPNAVLSGIFFGGKPTPIGEAKARWLGGNITTGGNWKGAFGKEGALIFGNGGSLPSSAVFSGSGYSEWTWNGATTDPAALQKVNGTDRIAACRYSYGSMEMNLQLTDGKAHKVSFYCVDWDPADRVQKLEVIDAATGKVLSAKMIGSFQKGIYCSWDISGSVKIRVSRSSGVNAVVSGIFIDPASAPL